MKNRKPVTIRIKDTGDILASSADPLRFESNLYFDERDVNMDLLEVTDRIYTCSYKGVCFWIDLRDQNGNQGESEVMETNVAWVYRDPLPGYEHIKNRIGFSSWDSQHLEVKFGGSRGQEEKE
ncbi:MAG: DUF427 domain-containing protein [Fidelibacterota bacterium]